MTNKLNKQVLEEFSSGSTWREAKVVPDDAAQIFALPILYFPPSYLITLIAVMIDSTQVSQQPKCTRASVTTSFINN